MPEPHLAARTTGDALGNGRAAVFLERGRIKHAISYRLALLALGNALADFLGVELEPDNSAGAASYKERGENVVRPGLWSPTPILFRLTTDGWCLRVLELEPIRRAARPIARAEPLRHDPLAAERAGVLKHSQPAVALQVLVEAETGAALAQDAREDRLAYLDRLAPQILSV